MAFSFSLRFIREEMHMALPTITSIVVAQTLYDILFQYVLTKEKEEKLEQIIKRMENHIKSKDRVPFSLPLIELEFLEEGLEELKLLNWLEIPVFYFEIETDAKLEDQATNEAFFSYLGQFITFRAIPDSNLIHVYPNNLTVY